MPTRNVNLTETQDKFVAEQLKSGGYTNASEVVRAGLRLLEQQAQEDAAKLEALRRDVQEGIDAYERGEYVTIDENYTVDDFFRDLDKDLDIDVKDD